jgi:hypothetical protein
LDEQSDGDSDWSDIDTTSAEDGADSADSESGNDDFDEVNHNIRHPAIESASCSSPLHTKQAEDMFYEALSQMTDQRIISRGFYAELDEWEDRVYPIFQEILIGRQGGKKLVVELPLSIWHPRAVLWVQGLHIMTQVLQNHPLSSTLSSKISDDSGGSQSE